MCKYLRLVDCLHVLPFTNHLREAKKARECSSLHPMNTVAKYPGISFETFGSRGCRELSERHGNQAAKVMLT